MEEGWGRGKAKRKEIKKIRMREDKKPGGCKAGKLVPRNPHHAPRLPPS